MHNDTYFSFLIITMNRFEDLQECLHSILSQDYINYEVIIVDNASVYSDYLEFKKNYENINNIKIIRSDENLGVSGGRNLGLRHVTGDIVITIDDDAILESNDSLTEISALFARDGDVGAIAFKIINYYTNQVESNEFPWWNNKRNKDTRFETSWIIGAGHAIRREVYRNIGYYRNYYPYGHEELDLSLRILDAGYKIYYEPTVIVLHKKSTQSRVFDLKDKEFFINQLSKRIIVAIRNLPFFFICLTSIIRTLQYLHLSNYNFGIIMPSLRTILNRLNDLRSERDVISYNTLIKLIKLRGPIY